MKALENHELFQKPYASFCRATTSGVSGINKKKVAFLVWSLSISGGTNVILNHARFLKSCGADILIVMCSEEKYPEWHPALKDLRIAKYSELSGKDTVADVCIITWWRTFFMRDKFKCGRYIYFVQSIESRFYLGSNPDYVSLVESTYTSSVPIIAVSSWIQTYLGAVHGKPSYLCRNGIQKNRFTPYGPVANKRKKSKVHYLVEGPLGVDFKQTELAIDYLQDFRDDIEVSLLTSSSVSHHDGVDNIYSCISIDDVPSIYRSCDILLKLSLVEGMFGPPLEMFHCGGTALVSFVTGAEEYMVDGFNSIVAPSSDDSPRIRASISKTISDSDYLNRLKLAAYETAKYWPSTDFSSMEFASHINHLLNYKSPSNDNYHELREYFDFIESRTSNNFALKNS